LLFLTFHLFAPLAYWWHRITRETRFDIVQFVESNLLFGDIAYAHFCHRAFLKHHWRSVPATGIRGLLRWMDHFLHAAVEPWTYRRARWIVVPSRGLARELELEYPYATPKIILLPNAVDLSRMVRPSDFDVGEARRRLGLVSEDLLLVFVALGQYERKGLPLLLDALMLCENVSIKVLVVGGTRDLVALYSERVRQMGLAKRVLFIGCSNDVRPYLWSAAALVLPSHYEVFPLVALEAAAAGIPLIVTRLNGVEEFLRDGENGILIKQRDPSSLAAGLLRFVGLPAESRQNLGRSAQRDVSRYALPHFVRAWSEIYQGA
jgi:glycosyltransferase involved in cell wall biosynthesis